MNRTGWIKRFSMRRGGLIGLALLAGSCLSVTYNHESGLPTSWHDELSERASFELDCPVEKLKIKKLGAESKAGVSGCEKRAVYFRVGYQWVKN